MRGLRRRDRRRAPPPLEVPLARSYLALGGPDMPGRWQPPRAEALCASPLPAAEVVGGAAVCSAWERFKAGRRLHPRVGNRKENCSYRGPEAPRVGLKAALSLASVALTTTPLPVTLIFLQSIPELDSLVFRHEDALYLLLWLSALGFPAPTTVERLPTNISTNISPQAYTDWSVQ